MASPTSELTHRQFAYPPQARVDAAAAFAWCLCGLKVALTASVLALLTNGYSGTVTALMVAIAIVADVADGQIFSYSTLAASKAERDRRRILDTLTDRLLLFAVLIPLTLSAALPAWFLLLVSAREALIDIAVGRPYIRHRFVNAPNNSSRLAMLLIGAQAIVVMLGYSFSLGMALLMSILSAAGIYQYFRRPVSN